MLGGLCIDQGSIEGMDGHSTVVAFSTHNLIIFVRHTPHTHGIAHTCTHVKCIYICIVLYWRNLHNIV